jgi:hypothetical protein
MHDLPDPAASPLVAALYRIVPNPSLEVCIYDNSNAADDCMGPVERMYRCIGCALKSNRRFD